MKYCLKIYAGSEQNHENPKVKSQKWSKLMRNDAIYLGSALRLITCFCGRELVFFVSNPRKMKRSFILFLKQVSKLARVIIPWGKT